MTKTKLIAPLRQRNHKLFLLGILAMTLLACNKPSNGENPLLNQPNTPYGVPAFDQIKLEHYLPAFEAAIAEQKEEVEAIANNAADPTFENTIVALDRTGLLLDRVSGVFFNVLEADGNDEMNEIAEKVSPMLSELSDGIILNDKLFQRVKFVYDQREQLGLNPEQMRLVTETYKSFADNGANLPEDKKERLKEINQELGLLSLKFGNNVVAETNSDTVKRFITDEAQLKGLPESAKAAAAEEAEAAGHPGEWLFTPKRTSFTPVLQYCENRELRKQLLMDYTTRANHDNEFDNKAVIIREMELRIEKAKLFGYDNPADYILADCMAKNHQTVDAFLASVWAPSLEAAKREAAELQKLLDEDLPGESLQPWDWWYYAEKLRKAKYDLDEEAIKPYFELDNVRKGAFGVATKLYGVQFEKLENMPVYNPEVEVFKVTGADGELIGILYTDYFPRAGKRPGAWMNDICHYMKLDPYFRKNNHYAMTFAMSYNSSENYILPLSHDEVVHLKCSMVKKMPGYEIDKYANLRAGYTFMFGHAGKKLLFMGQDFGQEREWSEARELDWFLLQNPLNKGMHDFVKELLTIYRKYPAMYTIDNGWEGFEWLNADDKERSVYSFYRKDETGKKNVLFVINMTPMMWENY